MNAKELAKACGLHYNTIYNMIKSGELKVEKVGKRYKVDDIQAEKLIRAKELCVIDESSYSAAEVVKKYLEEKQYRNTIQFFENIKETATLYTNFIEEVEKKNKNLEDQDVKEKIKVLFEHPATELVLEYARKIKDLEDINMELDYMQNHMPTGEDATKSIKSKYKYINENGVLEKPFSDHMYKHVRYDDYENLELE